jgi:sec-independent protein translocase protein TatA
MGFSFSHILLVLLVVLVVFGAGKLPRVMADFGKGLKAFKEGVKEGESDPSLLSDNTDKDDKSA